MRGARKPKVDDAIRSAALARENAAIAAGIDLTGNNPRPTNIAAGLSSIEEKSLGNIAQGGSGPIQGLLDYGEAPPGPGMWVMNALAYAPELLAGFLLAGAQMMLFTTGVGNSYGSALALALTIKLSPNPRPVRRRRDREPVRSGVVTPEQDVDAIRLAADDSVATVLRAIRPGERIRVQQGDAVETLEARDAIPLCHKISMTALRQGEPVRKYGEVIGVATAAIAAGMHVHVHNMASCRGKAPA